MKAWSILLQGIVCSGSTSLLEDFKQTSDICLAGLQLPDSVHKLSRMCKLPVYACQRAWETCASTSAV